MVSNRVTHALGELPLQRLLAAEAIERIDLDRPPALRLEIGIARNLADSGDAPLDPHQADHIGVAASLIGAQHQQILAVPLHPAGEGIDHRLPAFLPFRGVAAEQGGQRRCQGQAEA